MTDESKLIQRILEGDQESFARLVDIYKNYVFAIILNFIKDYEEVENVAQEVFLQIYISLPQFENDNLKAWISRITTNKSIDSLRSKRNRFKEERMQDSDKWVGTFNWNRIENPEVSIIEDENKKTIGVIIDSLPKIYADTIREFYFKDKSYNEIAREENISIKTVESRLYRARNMLKEKWRDSL